MKNKLAPFAGISACTIFYSSLLITALLFTGNQGESYSAMNHFISDLGDPRVSIYYPIFNIGIILAGVFFLIFAYGLGGLIKTKLANISVIIGMIASVLCSFIGVFPAHFTNVHMLVALSFFILMNLALTLFSICIWKNPNNPFPKSIALYGFCSPVALIVFFLMPKDLLGMEDIQGELFIRPDYWGLAIGEWAAFFFLTSWVVVASVYMIWKKVR